eukprot:COSAG05_NODE_451_length_9719_cov_13.497921_6_plen_55_part_00
MRENTRQQRVDLYLVSAPPPYVSAVAANKNDLYLYTFQHKTPLAILDCIAGTDM